LELLGLWTPEGLFLPDLRLTGGLLPEEALFEVEVVAPFFFFLLRLDFLVLAILAEF
jgi:hypothetical protein